MATTLKSLLELTRALAGDPSYEANSLTFEDPEIIQALNWAQDRYAEATQCTYTEASNVTAGSDGKIANPAGHIEVISIRSADTALVQPNATLTIPSTAANGSTIAASVPAQTGATFFWTAAGGQVISGQGTRAVQVAAIAKVGAVLTVGVSVGLNGAEATASADVPLT